MIEDEDINNQPVPEEEEHIELPFEPSGGDWVDWIYDHRKGLLAAVIAYLLLGVGVVTMRISLKPTEGQPAFYVDMSELDKLMEERDRLEQEVRELQMNQDLEREYYESIRNMASNADGELNSGLRDAQNTQASNIYDEAQAVQDRMRASREAYERGLQEAEGILNNRPQSTAGNDNTAGQGKQTGNVTVSYSLPGRHATYLPVPAYQCQGGGQITVDIAVNRNGQVVSATIAAGSVNDSCLREFALRAAQNSRFNTDGTADNRQGGTITYLFVPQ